MFYCNRFQIDLIDTWFYYKRKVKGNWSKKKKFIQKRGLAMIALDGSLGSDGPPLLTAITLNSYSLPSDKPPQVPFVFSPSISAA